VRRFVLWLFIAALIIIALVYYRRENPGSGLNVDRNAAHEIEKAKRR
jgi:hypothetical protein